MANIALVVGVSGITGSILAELLIEKGWITYGLARNPNTGIKGVVPIEAYAKEGILPETPLREEQP